MEILKVGIGLALFLFFYPLFGFLGLFFTLLIFFKLVYKDPLWAQRFMILAGAFCLGGFWDAVFWQMAVLAVSPAAVVGYLSHLKAPAEGKNGGWFPQKYLLTAMVVCGMVAMGAGMVMTPLDHLRQSVDQLMVMWSQTGSNPVVKSFIERFLPYSYGLHGIFLVLVQVLATVRVMGTLKRQNQLKRPVFDVKTLYLPWFYWTVLAGIGIMAAVLMGMGYKTAGAFAINLGAVWGTAFFVQGLSTVHVFAQSRSQPKMVLVLFYGIMLVFQWIFIFVVLLGVLEPWGEWRQRLKRLKE